MAEHNNFWQNITFFLIAGIMCALTVLFVVSILTAEPDAVHNDALDTTRPIHGTLYDEGEKVSASLPVNTIEPEKIDPIDQIEWTLIDERPLRGDKRIAEYLPYYVIQSSEVGIRYKKKIIQWRHYSDEDLVPYHVEEEYLLDASRVIDRWIRLTDNAPHTLRWQIQFKPLYRGTSLSVIDNSLVVGGQHQLEDSISLIQNQIYHIEIIRHDDRLRVIVDHNKDESIERSVSVTDRAPIRITAQIKPACIIHSTLAFGKGEGLSEPPALKPGGKPQWEPVYSENFSTAESIKQFSRYQEHGVMGWDSKNTSLFFDPIENNGDQIYVMLKQSLPGDIRVSFRARSMKKGQAPFFAVLVNHKGRLDKEHAYFLEWNYWQVQIKKSNVRKAGKSVAYKKKYRNQEWIQIRFEIHNGTITMYTDNEKVLSWTDPYPFKEPGHDLFSFYTWKVPLQIDDIIIERNLSDSVQPRPDHPVFVENYLGGNRDSTKQTQTDLPLNKENYTETRNHVPIDALNDF